MEELHPSPGLAALLEEHQGEIQSTWVAHLRLLPGSHYQQATEDELSSWTASGMAAITESLRRGSKEPLIAHAGQVSHACKRQGFAINEVVEGFLMMREAALEHLLADRELSSSSSSDSMRQFDAALRVLIARLAQYFAEAMNASLRDEWNRTAVLLDVTSVAGESLDPSKFMPEVAQTLLNTLGYCHCRIYLWDEASGRFSSCAEAGDLPNGQLRSLLGQQLDPATDSFAADALSTQEISTYRSASGFQLGELSCEDLGISLAVVLPIRLADHLLGFALVLATRPEAKSDSRALVLASGIAKAVAPAVDNARRHMQTLDLLVESQVLQQATGSLLEMEGLDDVATIICRESEALTGANGSAVHLKEEGAVPKLSFKHGEAISWSDEDLVTECPSDTSRLRLPLTVRGHTLGALVLQCPEGGFDEVTRRLTAKFADQAAIAVQHALLHQQHQQLAILKERQKLAQDLHDSATQSIYGVSMFSEAAARLLEVNQVERAGEILREMRDMALEALREMRLLVFELRPPLSQQGSLVSALQARLSAVEGRSGLTTELAVDELVHVPIRVAEALYGIAREALNNILKHAKATHVVVRLVQLESVLTLEIVDDGTGFEPTDSSVGGGLGLPGMSDRAASIGAHLAISSDLGLGTAIRVEVPLNAADREPSVSEVTT